ncbi:Choline/carnitine acyltransferase domain [Trypanosoma melophagium]|uniref:Choline/carnitine acyltransferase domain n=1 Tax=Trypanosoma melophagium TaxID=715481 RepID=UPI00351A922E|nr:Choline/carnitine acyltransferase domain [Trypanosoma melophagium]
MSSRKRSTKIINANGSATEDDAVGAATAAMLATVIRVASARSNAHVANIRPAQSRIVNLNSLRPHGALKEGELETNLYVNNVPPQSLLQDVLSMVHASQKILHQSQDFSLVVDPKEALHVLREPFFRYWFRDSIARECTNAAAYPFTKFYFAAPLPSSELSTDTPFFAGDDKCYNIANVIRRILLVFAKTSNASQLEYSELLFHVIRNDKNSANGLLLSNYNSRHITVCCGLYFYRIDVLDQTGMIESVDTIAKRLKSVKEHAECTEKLLREQKILPEALKELVAFYKLLACLTEVNRKDCAAIMERLKIASPVNEACLTALDSGIFGVVLRSINNSASSAHWFRNALVLEEEEENNVLSIRAHSTIICTDKLMDYLIQVLQLRDEGNYTRRCVETSSTAITITPGTTAATTPTKAATGMTVEESGEIINNILLTGVEFLEMWLPWKHRILMQPYAVIEPTPPLFDVLFPRENIISFACFCLSTVLAVQQVLTPSNEYPTVLVAFPNLKGGVSAQLLYSAEIETLIQSLRCESVLVDWRAKKYLVLKALKIIENIIDTCFLEPYPLYSVAKLLLCKEKVQTTSALSKGAILGAVDMFLTLNVLGTSGEILKGETRLVLPSRFAITCNAAGKIERGLTENKHLEANSTRASKSTLTCATLVSMRQEEELDIGERLAESISVNGQQLLSLMSM